MICIELGDDITILVDANGAFKLFPVSSYGTDLGL